MFVFAHEERLFFFTQRENRGRGRHWRNSRKVLKHIGFLCTACVKAHNQQRGFFLFFFTHSDCLFTPRHTHTHTYALSVS